MHINDHILSTLLEHNTAMSTLRLTDYVEGDETDVKEAIENICNYDRHLLQKDNGYGKTNYTVFIQSSSRPRVQSFLEAGGFKRLSEEADVIAGSLRQEQQLQMRKLQLEINDLSRRQAEQRSTRWISIIAIILAAISIVSQFLIARYYP